MQRETVLVVDDDEHCRQQCRTALEQAGYQVATARSADDALAACNLNPSLRQGCDLALVDYVMPGCDGFATFRRLKAVQPDLAGILLTGHTSLNVAIDALNLGFGQVVAKPIAPPDLVEAVQAALAERKTVLENARLRALTRLYDSLNQLATLVDPEELYRCIIDLAVAETSAHRVSLMLLDERCQWLRVVAATGLDRELASTARQRLGDPVSGWVLSHGVVLELGPDRPVPGPVRAALRRPEVTAAVCLPLYAAGEPLGVLNLSRLESQGGFQPGDLEITSVLAADAALTIQRLNLMQARARRERVATVGRLASTIIHDLRGPVTIIGGAAEMLADTNEQAAEPLAAIRDGVDELERMCRQLLSFARDSTTAVIEEFVLAQLLDEVVDDTAEEARAAGVSLVLAPVPAVLLEAARGDLRRVLADLLRAACEASPGGTLSLAATVADGLVEIELAGDAPEATTWWELVDEPTALAAGGAGLTLAILRHLAERHRGELVVTVQRTRYHLRLVLPERQGSR